MANGSPPPGRASLIADGPPPARHEALRLLRSAAAKEPTKAERRAQARGAGSVLLFRNALEDPGRQTAQKAVHQGAFVIASALRAAGMRVVWSDVKASRWSEADAARLISQSKGVNLIGLTLLDAYFESAQALLARLRAGTDAYIAVGGIMPTLNPLETFVHLPEADFVVRGAGEETVPRIMLALGAGGRSRGLDDAQAAELARIDGLLFSCGARFVLGAADKVPRPSDPDKVPLDFGLLEKENVASGIQLCLSRGCNSACSFCTSMDKGRFSGVSPARFAEILASYAERLSELFGRWSCVPPPAFGLGFYDDDFLAAPRRARRIASIVARSPFFLRFFQASVSSFFTNGEVDEALPAEAFAPKFRALEAAGRDPQVYLGTESFCDVELERLGKSHTAAQAEALAAHLSARRLRQAHHFIATNARTTRGDIAQSLRRIVSLRRRHAPYFSVLEPVIPHLKSFHPTPSRRRLERDGLADRIKLRRVLSIPGYPEHDYALVDHDEPRDLEAAEFARRLTGVSPVDWEGLCAQFSEPSRAR